MSELAPGSPWKAITLEALSAFAISRTPPALAPVTVLPAGCFARWIGAVNRPRSAKNLAKSETCDVPPREPDASIRYYWPACGHATASSGIFGALGFDYGQFQHGRGLRSGLGPLRDGGGQGLQRGRPSAQAGEAGVGRRRRSAHGNGRRRTGGRPP